MKNIFHLSLSLFFFVFLAAGCEDDDFMEPDPMQGETTFGIRADKTLAEYEALINSGGDRPDFEPVISFQYSLDGSMNQEFIATGILINQEWILTAGHNFFVADEQMMAAIPAGVTVYVGNDPNNPERTLGISEIVFHPTWQSSQTDFTSGNDLALVRLTAPITDITPAMVFRTTDEAIGAQVYGAGFGDYSTQPGQDENLLSRKHAFENSLDRKNTGISSSVNGVTYVGGLLAFDFDNPAGTINALGDNLVNTDEGLLGNGDSSPTPLPFEATTVTGDSGGPLFIKEGNVWKVAGILSGGADQPVNGHTDSSYGDISIYTRVSNHLAWIDTTVN